MPRFMGVTARLSAGILRTPNSLARDRPDGSERNSDGKSLSDRDTARRTGKTQDTAANWRDWLTRGHEKKIPNNRLAAPVAATTRPRAIPNFSFPWEKRGVAILTKPNNMISSNADVKSAGRKDFA